MNETKTLSGTEDSETFTISNISDNTNFIWNCLAYDNASQTSWADANYSVTVNIPAANITISSLSAISISETHKIFETVILNNGDTLLEDVIWSLDLGDGTVISSTYNTSLVADETVFLFVEYNYSVEGEYTVRVNATAVSDNLSAIKDLEVGASTLSVISLAEIYSNVSEKVFEFIINNTGEDNISVNWTLDFGNGNVVSSDVNANLTPGEDVFVFAQHNYLNQGDYTVVATAQADSSTDSASIVSEVNYIEVSNLSVINISATKRTFEFIVINRMPDSNLSDVAWSLDTGNGFKFNSTINVTLVRWWGKNPAG